MKVSLALLTAALWATAACAEETPIGKLIEKNGMAIGAVYLQPVLMEPDPNATKPSDVHLEADVHALDSNKNGFETASWIPYLTINYTLTKEGTGWKHDGMLMPMVAADGPHYGDNVKLDGPGKYHLSYHFEPPSKVGFMRHIDKETGVGPWWQPFDLQYDFAWIGSTGKKGGY